MQYMAVRKQMVEIFRFTNNRKNNRDPVCEKGSYSLSDCTCLVTHNLTCEYGISLQFGAYTPIT